MCACVCVCTCVRVGVRAYVCVCARADGGKEKYIWVKPPGLCDSMVCAEYLPHVHNHY